MACSRVKFTFHFTLMFLLLVDGQLIKVNSSLSTPRRHAGGVEVQVHLFPTSLLDNGEWSTSNHGSCSPRKEMRYQLEVGWFPE